MNGASSRSRAAWRGRRGQVAPGDRPAVAHRHEARDRQRQHHAPAPTDHAQPAPVGDHQVDGRRQRGVVRADRDDVMRVVGDRGGEGAGPEAESADETHGHGGGRCVAVDHRQLEQVAARVGFGPARDHPRPQAAAPGHELAVDRLDHVQPARGRGHGEIRRRPRMRAELIHHPHGPAGQAAAAVGGHEPSRQVGALDAKPPPVVHHDEVRRVALRAAGRQAGRSAAPD